MNDTGRCFECGRLRFKEQHETWCKFASREQKRETGRTQYQAASVSTPGAFPRLPFYQAAKGALPVMELIDYEKLKAQIRAREKAADAERQATGPGARMRG